MRIITQQAYCTVGETTLPATWKTTILANIVYGLFDWITLINISVNFDWIVAYCLMTFPKHKTNTKHTWWQRTIIVWQAAHVLKLTKKCWDMFLSDTNRKFFVKIILTSTKSNTKITFTYLHRIMLYIDWKMKPVIFHVRHRKWNIDPFITYINDTSQSHIIVNISCKCMRTTVLLRLPPAAWGLAQCL